MEKNHAHIFSNIVLENLGKHYAHRSDKIPVLKATRLSLIDFVLSVHISEIVINTFRLMPSSLLQVLLVELSNFDKNLYCSIFLSLGLDWIKGSVRHLTCVNVSVSTFCGSYLWPETFNNSLFFNAHQCPRNKVSFIITFNTFSYP